jgi:predicted  nucleic acid-binding Zn-ribbon protein
MAGSNDQLSLLQQLAQLHEVDLQVSSMTRELKEQADDLSQAEDGVAGLTSSMEQVDSELERARVDARASERAVDEKRGHLDSIRTRVNQVQNEKQYSAASLEFDLVRQDLRKLEDRVIDKLQVVEDLEAKQKALQAELEAASGEVGPQREALESRRKQIEEELTVQQDRRQNLAIRIDAQALGLYDRIRAGRSEVALAQLTEECVCGNCFTSVTVQQEMQIRSMSILVCCEGCGVILYPGDMQSGP